MLEIEKRRYYFSLWTIRILVPIIFIMLLIFGINILKFSLFGGTMIILYALFILFLLIYGNKKIKERIRAIEMEEERVRELEKKVKNYL